MSSCLAAAAVADLARAKRRRPLHQAAVAAVVVGKQPDGSSPHRLARPKQSPLVRLELAARHRRRIQPPAPMAWRAARLLLERF
jgi:hypothetical protein